MALAILIFSEGFDQNKLSKGAELWDQTESLSDSAPVSSTTEGMLVLVVLVRSKCNTATRVYYIMHTTYNTIVQVHAFTYQAGK